MDDISILEFKDEALRNLATHGIDDALAWDDWCRFSDVQAAGCLTVDSASVSRFLTWRTSGNDDDAWS